MSRGNYETALPFRRTELTKLLRQNELRHEHFETAAVEIGGRKQNKSCLLHLVTFFHEVFIPPSRNHDVATEKSHVMKNIVQTSDQRGRRTAQLV